ncbi:hypothetical protein CEXT_678361 [Caerostris extrusa]|uniref:Uncharacterized protein n=1 Tax=Caerostris extrusa TaxID=172846 RepID=A0AAV4VLZ3_CAEEX|nr:hypothetical protein CEXT_678361 [Caerostris extrusa]
MGFSDKWTVSGEMGCSFNPLSDRQGGAYKFQLTKSSKTEEKNISRKNPNCWGSITHPPPCRLLKGLKEHPISPLTVNLSENPHLESRNKDFLSDFYVSLRWQQSLSKRYRRPSHFGILSVQLEHA